MFKKLLSNLPFNPSLIGQVSFYAKRLHSERTVRRAGLIILLLAMAMQLFAVVSPPQASLASSADNDLIPGGFSNREQAVLHCLDPSKDYGKILAHYNITCDDVNQTATVHLQSTDYGKNLYSMGRKSYGFPGETPVTIDGVAGGSVYLRHLWSWDTNGPSSYSALSGKNKDGLTFFILFNCGNLVFIGIPPVTPPPPPPPPAELSCSNLVMNVADGARVNLGSTVSVRGQASGSHLPGGQKVDMHYQFVAASTNKIVATGSAIGVSFQGTAANDPGVHNFSSTIAGTYLVKLIVNYDGGKIAKGSAAGDCIKRVVIQPACSQSSDIKHLENCIEVHKHARNITQNVADANNTTAHPGDVIEYTLSATNSANVPITKYVFQENISDILDYADTVDLHGATLGKLGFISWPAVTLKAKSTTNQVFTVKVKDPLPTTPRSTSDPGHFDMVMTNVYGDTVTIKLPPPPSKQIELTSQELPNTGPGASLIIGFAITAIAGYFFARTRLMSKEIDEVRKEFSSSGGHS